jgi:hypothetical protein
MKAKFREWLLMNYALPTKTENRLKKWQALKQAFLNDMQIDLTTNKQIGV